METKGTAKLGLHHPKCMEGERACPPEDVGGITGYEELLAVLADSEHEDHEMMRLWSGDEFEPERFSVEAVNQALARLREAKV